MSDSLPRERFEELCELITALHEKWITEEETARLEAYICSDDEACRLYVEYTHLYANLRWREMQEPELQPPAARGKSEPARSPVLGFLGDAFQSGIDFLSRGLVVSLLLTVGLPGILLLILLLAIAREPSPTAVARVVRMHECVLANDSAPLAAGAKLYAKQPIHLVEGLVEAQFADGSNVILEAPCRFEAHSRREGFLRAGSLVAQVPKGAEGFAIVTPAARVVDLGTEFGVRVPEKGDAAEIQVFRGKVALATGRQASEGGGEPRRLAAGQAARVEKAGGQAVVRQIAALSDRFVRRIPKPAIVADFSRGLGQSDSRQFPGTAGAGWAAGWYYLEAEGIRSTVSLDRAAPLGDGDYLRVLIERESGTELANRTVERRLDVNGPVDLTKPHVVSMHVRIDTLGAFDKPNDNFLLCNNQHPNAVTRPFATSGWHIRFDGADYRTIPAKTWAFISGNGKGRETRIGSGIPVVEGTVYSMRVLVDPAARRWTPSIAVDGGPFTTFKPMGMRGRGTAAEREYWPYLYLWWKLEGGNRGEEREKIGFSVDSIRITAAE